MIAATRRTVLSAATWAALALLDLEENHPVTKAILDELLDSMLATATLLTLTTAM